MKIMFVSTMEGSSWGASEELWSQAALRLISEGHEVSASVKRWRVAAGKVTSLEDAGVSVYHREPQAGFNLTTRIKRKVLRRLKLLDTPFDKLQTIQPDLVVISQGTNGDGLEWMEYCIQRKCPFAVVIHSNPEVWWPDDVLSASLAVAYDSAKIVFGVSQHNLQLLDKQMGKKLPNSRLVWNPISLRKVVPPPWPKSIDAVEIACVARLYPIAKGQDLLFSVLAHSKWRGRGLKVNLYGSGPHEQVLRKLAEFLRLENVCFHGHVSELDEVWAKNQLLILPSRFEGLPNTLLEAMWYARPALVTDVGGCAEMCFDGQTGFVATSPTIHDIDHALERAWEYRGQWRVMGENARSRAEALIPDDPVGIFCEVILNCCAKVN